MTIFGKWDAQVATPIGTQNIKFDIQQDSDGTVRGTATDKHATIEMQDVHVNGQRLTWKQCVTRPLRLDLRFDVEVDGDLMQGFAMAGVLPRSRVIAKRLQ